MTTMKLFSVYLTASCMLLLIGILNSCTHDSLIDDDLPPVVMGCETVDVSFSQTVLPILETHCTGCHGSASPQANIDLSNYDGVKAVADNGRLVGAISHDDSFSNMPQGGNKLPDCTIDQIEAWADDGAPDN